MQHYDKSHGTCKVHIQHRSNIKKVTNYHCLTQLHVSKCHQRSLGQENLKTETFFTFWKERKFLMVD
jgi:hypothetical protein